MTRFLLSAAIVLILGAGGAVWWLAAAADEVTVDKIGDQVQTRPRGQLPVFADTDDMRALYKFATEQPDVLGYMPCVCGCVDLGHTSNRSCYVKAETPSSVTYTSHAGT